MGEILIKNGEVIDPETGFDEKIDLLLRDGKISQLGGDIYAPEADVLDASGFIVSPGLIDIHTHLREPGREDKETIRTGTMSAVKGGFTSIACKANTGLIVDDPSVVGFIFSRARKEGFANVFPIGAVTDGLLGLSIADIGRMVEAGIVAISDDGASVVNAQVMRCALEYSQIYNLVVIAHSEDVALTGSGAITESEMSLKLGLPGIPVEAERIFVARDCLMAEMVGGKLHIDHCSSAPALFEVRRAKDKGVDVTCETAPHYFSLDYSAVEDYKTEAKMNPPLRSREDVNSVIDAIKDGTIDIIASDHAPHTLVEKDIEFQSASFGIIGLETTLPLIITKLVKENHLTLNQALKMVTVNPARRLNLKNKGFIKVGADADITIFDPEKKQTIKDFTSKGVNSPFTGMELYGVVEYTIVGGKIRYHKGDFYERNKPFRFN
jgi:dihydroorotase